MDVVYDCVFFPSTETWADIPPERVDELSKMVAKEQAAMFVGSRGDNVVRACLFAKRMGFDAEPYLAIAWRHLNVRAEPKMAREGPDKCISTDMTLVWCFARGPLARAKPVSLQSVVAKDTNPSQIFDAVADHFQDLERRLFVTNPGGIKRATSEFATLCIDPASGEQTDLQPRGRFTISSARKGRMFKAHLGQSTLPDLLIDRRVLTAYYEGEPYDENRPVLTYIASMQDNSRTTVMGMIKSAIASKRRRAQTTSKSKPPTRKLTKGLGIAKKTPITDKFADFLEKSCDLDIDRSGDLPAVARTDVVRALPKYIKAQNLSEGRAVCYTRDPDGLQRILPEGFDQDITFFSLYKHINHHFNPKKD
jgi:hypothetical protein